MLEPVSSGQGDGVELGARVPHEGRFQDVTALPVNQEPSLVHVHVGTGRLEVQRHWGNVETGTFIGSCSALRAPGELGERHAPIWQPAFHRGTGL